MSVRDRFKEALAKGQEFHAPKIEKVANYIVDEAIKATARGARVHNVYPNMIMCS